MAAREVFDAALNAVDPRVAVRNSIQTQGSSLIIRGEPLDLGDQPIYSIAIGKAALSMAAALEQQIGKRFKGGVISGPASVRSQLSERWQQHEGGHPTPNESSLLAARDSLALLDRANNEGALLIFLVSGGGSAMLEWPANDDISLADLQIANRTLVNSGASISEINAVRRAFSAMKGGRLAARAPNCDEITLIVSDVPNGEERNVASGPTLAPTQDAPKAVDVIARYELEAQLPTSIIRAIKAAPEPLEAITSHNRQHITLLDNQTALEAAAEAARSRGFIAEIATDISDQAIEEGCEELIKRLAALHARHRETGGGVCLISGGEFACPVRGDGIGGRNQETSLRLAISPNLISPMVALCAGTDGIDGNSPAAGAIVDDTTIERAKSVALDVEDFLRRSDAYSFFVAIGDAVTTGSTGTNVRDLRILLAGT
jgi:glycerate 2-kinase